jgi:hypothetical protein
MKKKQQQELMDKHKRKTMAFQSPPQAVLDLRQQNINIL